MGSLGFRRPQVPTAAETETATTPCTGLRLLGIFFARLVRRQNVTPQVEEFERHFLRIGLEVVVDVDCVVEESDRILRVEQPEISRHNVRVHLPQGSDAAHDPERPPVRRNHQVMILDDEIGHLRHRQIHRERLPRRPVVPRHVDGPFGRSIEHPGPDRILTDGPHEVVAGNPADDLRPRLSVVGGFPHVRAAVVVHEVPDPRDIGLARCIRRHLDRIDANEVGGIRRCHVGPRRRRGPSVSCDVHVPVIGAGPDHVGVVRRRGDGKDRRIGLHSGLILGDRTARSSHRRGVVACQVRADLDPTLTLGRRLPDLLRTRVDDSTVVLVEYDREGPLHPFAYVLGRLTHGVLGPDVDRSREARTVVVA